MIALQGPSAASMLSSRLTGLRYYRCVDSPILEVSALTSRTGYTGEDGFEFIVPAADAGTVWDGLRQAGGVPCGLGCRDTLRLEAGMPLYGHELTEEVDPITAGLAFAVSLEKEFVGLTAVAAIATAGPERVRVGLRLSGKRIAREGTPILAGDKRIGVVTSGTFSPTFQESIAVGYVPQDHAAAGMVVGVDIRGKCEEATVVPLPFYRRAES